MGTGLGSQAIGFGKGHRAALCACVKSDRNRPRALARLISEAFVMTLYYTMLPEKLLVAQPY
jgi:hypothetical protein